MSELENARYRLHTAIEEFGVYEDPNEIHDLINDYAHELAEKIRQDTTVMGEPGDQYAMLYAALIDPATTT